MLNFAFKYIILIVLALAITSSCKEKKRTYSAKEKKTFTENLLKANKGLVSKDQENIEAYVEVQGWQMNKTKSGLWYQIIDDKSTEQAQKGQTAHLRYQVSLLSGEICYSSDSTGIKQFKIGQGGIESGLEEGILFLSEGDAARFIMPPHLAHGLLGDENKIPPRTTIVYNVELLKLTN